MEFIIYKSNPSYNEKENVIKNRFFSLITDIGYIVLEKHTFNIFLIYLEGIQDDDN